MTSIKPSIWEWFIPHKTHTGTGTLKPREGALKKNKGKKLLRVNYPFGNCFISPQKNVDLVSWFSIVLPTSDGNWVRSDVPPGMEDHLSFQAG